MASLVTMYRRIFPYNSDLKSSEVGLTTSQTMKEKAITKLLSPFESYVVSVQSLLIWENPYLSGITLLLVNFLFWLIVAYSHRFYTIIATVGIVLFTYSTWVNQIWPEIRVPPAEDEDTEEWTPVNPQVLSVPEISRYLSQFTSNARKCFERLVQMRKDNHGQFCSLMTGILLVFVYIGQYVSGVFVAYILVMSIMLVPGFIVHILPKVRCRTCDNERSAATAFLDSCSQNMKRFFKKLKSLPILIESSDSDSQDNELNEFIPETNKEVLTTLHTPFIVSEIEISEPTSMPSVNQLDDILNDHDDDDELALPAQAVAELPNFEQDSVDDSIIPEEAFALPTEQENEMQFVPTHFDDSDSEDDVKEFSEGLHFPDSQSSSCSQFGEQSSSNANYAGIVVSAITSTVPHIAEVRKRIMESVSTPDRPSQDGKNKKKNVPKDQSQLHRFSESLDSDLTDFEIVSESELVPSNDD